MLRRLVRVAIVAVALVLVAAAALYFLRLELATRWLERELARQGMTGASLRVTRLAARGITLQDIALGPELRVRELALDLDLGAPERPLGRVRVEGARLRLDLQPGVPLLGKLDALLRVAMASASRGGSEPRGGLTDGLPVLEIKDTQVALLQGTQEALVDVSLRLGAPDEAGSASGEIHLTARELAWKELGLESAVIDVPFRLSSSPDSVSVAWTETARAELQGAAGFPVRVAGAIQVRSSRGRVSVHQGDALDVRPDLELVVDLPGLGVNGAEVPPSQWHIKLKGPSAEHSSWSLRANATALKERVRAGVRATFESTTRIARARVTLAPLEFSLDGLQPAELDPRLASLQGATGKIAAVAELRWSGGELRASHADVTLSSLGFRSSGAVVVGLGGVIHLASLSPLASSPAQVLDAIGLDVGGIRFRQPHVRFALTSEGVRVEEARLKLGSGTLRIRDALLGPTEATREWTVQAADLELEELLALARIEGVSGSGTISGSIPVRSAGDSIELHDAVLESSGPGRLRIRSKRVRSALGSAGATVEQLVSALEDFHYETLKIELEKPAQGDSIARLHLLGRNPAVLEGHPFALNVNLEFDLEPLLRAFLQALQLTGDWSQRESRGH